MPEEEDQEEIDATDAAIKLADQEGIDLATVTGTGDEGRILKSDVERTIDALADEKDADKEAHDAELTAQAEEEAEEEAEVEEELPEAEVEEKPAPQRFVSGHLPKRDHIRHP